MTETIPHPSKSNPVYAEQPAGVILPNPEWGRDNAGEQFDDPLRKSVARIALRSASDPELDEEMLQFVVGPAEEPPKPLPSELPRSPRLEKVFAPMIKADESKSEPDDHEYDDWVQGILTDDGELDLSESMYQLASKKANERRYPEATAATKDASAERIGNAMTADYNLRDIVYRHTAKTGPKNRWELVDMVRTDPDLRYDLGNYFLEKIDTDWRVMPERVLKNTEKGPSYPVYKHIEKMSSREYASLLALAMIDGTFEDSKSAGDRIDYGKDGRATQGQHRAAAMLLLK